MPTGGKSDAVRMPLTGLSDTGAKEVERLLAEGADLLPWRLTTLLAPRMRQADGRYGPSRCDMTGG